MNKQLFLKNTGSETFNPESLGRFELHKRTTVVDMKENHILICMNY